MFRPEKKPRLGAPAPAAVTALAHVTGPASVHIGPAAVHTLFVRLALATNAKETLGMLPDTTFTDGDVWRFFRASWRVLACDNEVNIDWICRNKLQAVADAAEDRLVWARQTLWDELVTAEGVVQLPSMTALSAYLRAV